MKILKYRRNKEAIGKKSTAPSHRRLAEEGISFKAFLDETRFSIASEYLRNTQLGIEEIASRCGYGDVSNFRKAFKRWSGLSPSEFR
jgi:AraC-like DNA-binding protein